MSCCTGACRIKKSHYEGEAFVPNPMVQKSVRKLDDVDSGACKEPKKERNVRGFSCARFRAKPVAVFCAREGTHVTEETDRTAQEYFSSRRTPSSRGPFVKGQGFSVKVFEQRCSSVAPRRHPFHVHSIEKRPKGKGTVPSLIPKPQLLEVVASRWKEDMVPRN